MKSESCTYNKIFSRLLFAAAIVSVSPISHLSYAGEKENQIIDKAVAAYGGDKLLNLKSFKYTDTLFHYFEHQSGHALQGPTTQHLNEVQLLVSVDLENQRSELRRSTRLLVGYHDSRNITATHRIFKDGKGFNVDHFLQEYQPSSRINFGNADLAYSQMLDPVIVRNMANEKHSATWVDTAYIQGEAHDVLSIHPDTDSEYWVYIHQDSGLLSRMLQKRGANLRTYNFLQHQQSDGIAWSKQLYVSTEQQAVYHSNSRKLYTNFAINSHEDGDFNLPNDYRQSPDKKPFDVSSLTLRELVSGVYYVGKGWGYTLFIDAGDYYISAGAWAMADRSEDWKQALELLHQTTKKTKPVKLHLVSHHHTDHMSELHDVLDHGAKLLVHPSDVKSVRAFLKDRVVSDEQFSVISDDKWLADNKIMLFDAPSSQASHNLALYVPEYNLVFAEDIFGSSLQTGHHSPRNWPHMDTYQRLAGFMKHLQELDIQMDTFVSSHHGRILNKKDIAEALNVQLPPDDVILQRLFAQKKQDF